MGLTALPAGGCAELAQGVLTATYGNDTPFTGMISAGEALKYARGEKPGTPLSSDQRKIVYLVAEMQKSALAREMTERAASFGYYYAIHNHAGTDGLHLGGKKLIALKFTDDGANSGASHDYGDTPDISRTGQQFRILMAHELTHLYQEKIWRNAHPPALRDATGVPLGAMNSFDRALWKLALEAQAMLFADSIADQIHLKSVLNPENYPATDPAPLFARYIREDNFHPGYYKIDGARCDDGRPMTAEEFSDAFGIAPGGEGNFLKPLIRSRKDIYGMFAENRGVLAAAKAGGCPMDDPPLYPDPAQMKKNTPRIF